MMLLLALLLAAPERVTIVAKPKQHSALDDVAAAAKRAWKRLYEKTDPDVDEGNALAAQNEPEKALEAYDRALPRMPDEPRLHFDRSNQLLKLGSEKAKEAHEEALRALNSDDRSLKAKASFDLGLSDEEMGNPDEAMKAYAQTLQLDPDDVDAKANLELLLKQEERKKQQQQQQSDQKNQQKDQKDQQQQQQQSQQQPDQKKETPKEDKNQQQPQQQAKQEEKKQEQKPEEKQVDRTEAERLLDALRAGEKNLQAWRFAKDKKKEMHRGDVEKDW